MPELLRPPFRRHLTTRGCGRRERLPVASSAISTASHNTPSPTTSSPARCFVRHFDGISQHMRAQLEPSMVASSAISTASHNLVEDIVKTLISCFVRHFDGISQRERGHGVVLQRCFVRHFDGISQLYHCPVLHFLLLLRPPFRRHLTT